MSRSSWSVLSKPCFNVWGGRFCSLAGHPVVVIVLGEKDAGAAEGHATAAKIPPASRDASIACESWTRPPLILRAGALLHLANVAQISAEPSCRRPVSVRRELVRPELSPDLSYLVACLLAFRIGGEHVVVPPVGEHLQHLGGGLLEEPDRREVLLVLAAQRRRRLQGAKPGLGRLVGRESLLDSGASSARPRSCVV